MPSSGWSASVESTTDVAIDTTGQSHHRCERKSPLVPSNQPISEWENAFSTSAMTEAAIVLLVDHSTIVQISGESYRRKRAGRTGRSAAG
ncbi:MULTISPECIES: ATP-binding protein [unclassified Cyanobium]|uniref:ATP-binding protein n=1 Tax=unclassified Cyanobium TaxID=2627006 RepID=UPI0037C0F0F9